MKLSTDWRFLFVFMTAFAFVNGKPGVDGGYGVPRYAYQYGVSDKFTGDYKTAYEYREGGITKGSYSVLQPDGVLRTVNYIVDPILGFQAQVLNKGIAQHAPIYGKGSRGAYGYYG